MSKQKLYEIFQNPGIEWRGKPFWSWNGELREDEVRRQINVMQQMGLGGYFMHSRAGLITEYLGEEWFDLINAGADEGERIGLEAWLYDEDRWPSGSAGGMVTADPQYRMKSIVITEQSPDTFVRAFKCRFAFSVKCSRLISIFSISLPISPSSCVKRATKRCSCSISWLPYSYANFSHALIASIDFCVNF